MYKRQDEICLTDHVEPVEWLPDRPAAQTYDWQALTAEFEAARAAVGDTITLSLIHIYRWIRGTFSIAFSPGKGYDSTIQAE